MNRREMALTLRCIQMITDFQTSRRGGNIRVWVRLSDGSCGHGEAPTTKEAKRLAVAEAKGKGRETRVWMSE